MNTGPLGVLFGLVSALVWGSGDFSGGVATRRSHPYVVLAAATFAGMAMLLVFAPLRGEPAPTASTAFWAALSGVFGILGIGSLYRALASGSAVQVAPTAGVVGALLPVLFTLITRGLPGGTQMAGFAVALPGIWLVSRSPAQPQAAPSRGFWLAVLAGCGFGGFFITIAQVDPGTLFIPLVVSKLVSFCLTLLILLRLRVRPFTLHAPPAAWLAGLLDAGGNIFFLLATQLTRLDVATVLASLYPAATVLLAYWVLREKIAPAQWAGLVLCLAAVAFIAL